MDEITKKGEWLSSKNVTDGKPIDCLYDDLDRSHGKEGLNTMKWSTWVQN